MRNITKRTCGRLGVNLIEDPTNLQDEELVRATNLWPEAAGNLATRPSMDFVRKLAGLSVAPQVIYDFVFSSVPNIDIVMAYQGVDGNSYLVAFYGDDSSTPLQYMIPVAWGKRPQIFNFLDITIVLGQDANFVVRKYQHGASDSTAAAANDGVTEFTGYTRTIAVSAGSSTGGIYVFQGNSFTPRFIAERAGRLVLANLGNQYESMLVWGDSAPAKDPRYSFPPDILSATGRTVIIGAAAEGPITAIAAAANSPEQYPEQQAVYVFKRDWMHTVYGSPNQSTDTTAPIFGDMRVVRNNIKCGCISQASITQTPFGLIWCGPDDVWFMPFGNQPYPIGTKIRPRIKDQPPSLLWKIHAEYHDGRYQLALFTEGQGGSDLDVCGEQWWLDLRHGLPKSAADAKWYGPQVYGNLGSKGTTCMHEDGRDGRARILHSITATTYSENNGAETMLVSLDGQDSRDTQAPQSVDNIWQSGQSYNVGDTIAPNYNVTSYPMTGHMWKVIACYNGSSWVSDGSVSGTSAGSEPAWEAGYPQLDDNTVRWSAVRVGGTPHTYESAYAPKRDDDDPIAFELVTKEWVEPDPMLEKVVTGALVTEALENDDLRVYRHSPDSDDTLKTLVFDPVGPSLPFEFSGVLYPYMDTVGSPARVGLGTFTHDSVNTVGLAETYSPMARMARKWGSRFYPPSENQRVRSRSVQFRMSNVGVMAAVNGESSTHIPASAVIIDKRYATFLVVRNSASPSLAVCELGIINGAADLGDVLVYQDLDTYLSNLSNAVYVGTTGGHFLQYTGETDTFIGLQSTDTTGVQPGLCILNTFNVPAPWSGFALPSADFPYAKYVQAGQYLFGRLGYGRVSRASIVLNDSAYTYAEHSTAARSLPRVKFKDVAIEYRPFKRRPL
jgi:hypothetical protein